MSDKGLFVIKQFYMNATEKNLVKVNGKLIRDTSEYQFVISHTSNFWHYILRCVGHEYKRTRWHVFPWTRV